MGQFLAVSGHLGQESESTAQLKHVHQTESNMLRVYHGLSDNLY